MGNFCKVGHNVLGKFERDVWEDRRPFYSMLARQHVKHTLPSLESHLNVHCCFWTDLLKVKSSFHFFLSWGINRKSRSEDFFFVDRKYVQSPAIRACSSSFAISSTATSFNVAAGAASIVATSSRAQSRLFFR